MPNLSDDDKWTPNEPKSCFPYSRDFNCELQATYFSFFAKHEIGMLVRCIAKGFNDFVRELNSVRSEINWHCEKNRDFNCELQATYAPFFAKHEIGMLVRCIANLPSDFVRELNSVRSEIQLAL
ncbi:hypothetical protein CEXT_472061 [Caerostris extrusa]|uniref:Uncharacterized protein n=1 Tax=Caerostris extrusa TaxID=172846 RepID=A0AAV4T6W0_CAEEX|nr:hypothetical protein CEXT_472061 [Caerostris extrusa]